MAIRLAILFCIVISCLAAPHAVATMYSVMSPEEVTERTDVWVWGRVLEWSGPITGEDMFDGPIRDVTLKLKVLAATDPDVPESIVLRSKTTFSTNLPRGSEVFVALKKKDEEWVTHGSLGLQGWFPTNELHRGFGGPKDFPGARTYWTWLRDVSYVVHNEGKTTLNAQKRWETALDEDDPARIRLACDYFALLANPEMDSELIAAAYARVYDMTAEQLGTKKNIRYYELESGFSRLTSSVSRAIANVGPNGGAGILMDVLERAGLDSDLFKGLSIQPALLKGIEGITDPALLSRIPDLYESSVRLDRTSYRSIPRAASTEIDAWLWRTAIDAEENATRDDHVLREIWRALAMRGDPEIISYLGKIAQEFRDRVPTRKFKGGQAGVFASEILLEFQKRELPKKELVLKLVRRIAKGEMRLLVELEGKIRPGDDFIVEPLLALPAYRWGATNLVPRYSTAAKIIAKLPDPRFAPFILRWLGRGTNAELLSVLALCGEEEEAIRRSVLALDSDFPDDSRLVWEGMRELSKHLLFLGSFKRQELAAHIAPYVEPSKLKELEAIFFGPGGERPDFQPYPIWDVRDAARMALAKSGDPRARSLLTRSYEDGDIREKFVAAFALRLLGEETGSHLVEAYRMRGEREIPELAARWGNDSAGVGVILMAMEYLDDPDLDRVFLDRIKRGISYSDDDFLYEAKFIARHYDEILRSLMALLDHRSPDVRDVATDCLQTITSERFGHHSSFTRARREAAAAKWKEHIAQLLNDAA